MAVSGTSGRSAKGGNMKALIVAAALVAPLAVTAPAFAQQGPSLVGSWKGPSDGVGKESGYVTADYGLVIEEQRGRSFKGKVIYPVPGGTKSEPIHGTVTPDLKTVYVVGDDGIHIGALQPGGALDLCYLESSDDDALALCARLSKQP